jgi:peptidoglycan/LPS O-acetylase OafA/YrhL
MPLSSPPEHQLDLLRQRFRGELYFPSLDGLRALSIVPVLWHHATPRPYPGVLGRGPIGVDLFFAISGFLITTLLLREREAWGEIDLSGFYARRSLRIFPLYYLVLGLHLAFAVYIRPDWEPSRTFVERWPYYATYCANWLKAPAGAGPVLFVFAWSLCTEEQFYAFWAPILRWCRLSVATTLMGAWLLLDIAIESDLGFGLAVNPPLLRTIVTSFATPIGFGALLAIGVHSSPVDRWMLWMFGRRASAPIVGVVATSLILFPWANVLVLHLALALLVVSCSVRRDHGLERLLNVRSLRFVGQVSYGIYLWHVPVIGALRALAPVLREQAACCFALALPISVGVAALSHRAFELPMIQFGAKFRRRPKSLTQWPRISDSKCWTESS